MQESALDVVYYRFRSEYKGPENTLADAFGVFTIKCVDTKQKYVRANRAFDIDAFFSAFDFASLESLCVARLDNSQRINSIIENQARLELGTLTLRAELESKLVSLEKTGRFLRNLITNLIASLLAPLLVTTIYVGAIVGFVYFFDEKWAVDHLKNIIVKIQEFSN